MARRLWHRRRRGQIYAKEWAEYHIECAVPFCDAATQITSSGQASTARTAERILRQTGLWQKDGEFWYCPACRRQPKAAA